MARSHTTRDTQPDARAHPRPSKKPRTRRRGRRLLIALLVVLIVLGAAVWLLGPAIASPIAAGVIQQQVSMQIAGSVRVSDVALSWTGHQRVGTIELRDPQGQLVAHLEIDLDAGLLDLARGSRDLGASTLTGRLDLVRAADGSTNLQRALAPTTPPKPSTTPPSVPPNLGFDLAIQNLEITLADESSATPTRIVVEGSAVASTGAPATLDLSAIVTEPTADPGTITLAGSIQDWSNADGLITPDDLTLDGTLIGTDLPVASADRLAGLDGRLVEALGDRLAWTATVSGTTKHAAIELSAQAPSADASLAASLTPTSIELTAPATVTLRQSRAIALAPALAERLDAAGQTLTLDEAPTLTLRIDALRAELDEDSGALSAISANASASADAMSGTIDSGADAPRRFAISPMTLDLAVDESGTATLTTRAAATIDTLDAGTLDVSLALANALTTESFDPRSLVGTVALAGLDATLIEPFVADSGIDITADLGPTLAARLAMTPAGESSQIDLTLDTAQLTGQAALVLDEQSLRARDAGVSLAAARGGAILAAVLGQPDGPALRSTGSVTLNSTDLSIPLAGDSLRARLDATTASIELAAADLAIAPPPSASDAPDLTITSAALTAQLAPGRAPHATLDAAILQGDQRATATGDLTIASLAAVLDGVSDPAALGLSGTIELVGLDHSLVGWLPAEIQTTSGEALDLAQLAEQAWGPTLRTTLTLTPADKGATAASLTARGKWASLSAHATVSHDALSIDNASIIGRLGLRAFRTLGESFGPAWNTPPRLKQPAPYELRLEPTTIALGQHQHPATLRAQLAMPSTTIIGTSLLRSDGSEFRPGPVTLDQATIAVQLPLGAADQPADQSTNQPIRIRAQLGVQDRTGNPVAQIAATAEALPTAPGGPTRLHASATLDEVDPAWLGTIAASTSDDADLLVGVLGGPARADLTYDRTGDQQTMSLALDAPSLRTSQAMTLVVEPARIRLARPVRLTGQLAPETLSRLALGPDADVAFDQPTPWAVQLDRLDLPRATEHQPEPGPVTIDAGVSMPTLAVTLDDGSNVVYHDLQASVRSDPNDATIVMLTASASTDTVPDALAVNAHIRGLGGATTSQTTVDLTASLDRAPTALLDALLSGRGVIADALGPTASATITATNLSRTAGTLDAQLTSPLATGRFQGRVGAGVLELDEPATVSVSRFGPGLMRRLAALSPMIGQIEKRPEDGPATLTIADLRMPTDGDLRKLDAHLTLNIGTARFKASEAFAPLLGVVNWQADTTIGRRLAPLVVTIDKGVASTDSFTLPLGEFEFESSGSYDLVTRQVDVVTMIPLGLLSDDVARSVESSTRQLTGPLGQVGLTIEPITKIPFRLRGPIASATPQFDAQLFVDKFLGDQLKPENIIRNQAGDLLDGLFGGKPKKKKNDGGG